MCETLHIHRCPFLLFYGLGKLHLPWCEQLFQSQTPAPVPGQESCARQAERRVLGRGGPLEEEGSAGPHPDPAGVSQSLSMSAQSQNPIEAEGNLSFGFCGVFWSQPSCFTKPEPGLVPVPIAAVSLPKTLQPPLPCHPLPLQLGVGRI